MKKLILLISALLCCGISTFAQDGAEPEKKKVYRGFEGGVLFYTGYAFENFAEIAYHGGGVPLGVGGRGLARFGDHFRVGGEGYMNTMGIDSKGSETIYAFGGGMADFCWAFGPVLTYIGSNIGGGILKNYIANEEPSSTWEEIPAYHNKRFVWAAHPYIGAQIKIAKRMSIIIHISYTLPLNGNFCQEFNCINTCIGLEFGD